MNDGKYHKVHFRPAALRPNISKRGANDNASFLRTERDEGHNTSSEEKQRFARGDLSLSLDGRGGRGRRRLAVGLGVPPR